MYLDQAINFYRTINRPIAKAITATHQDLHEQCLLHLPQLAAEAIDSHREAVTGPDRDLRMVFLRTFETKLMGLTSQFTMETPPEGGEGMGGYIRGGLLWDDLSEPEKLQLVRDWVEAGANAGGKIMNQQQDVRGKEAVIRKMQGLLVYQGSKGDELREDIIDIRERYIFGNEGTAPVIGTADKKPAYPNTLQRFLNLSIQEGGGTDSYQNFLNKIAPLLILRAWVKFVTATWLPLIRRHLATELSFA